MGHLQWHDRDGYQGHQVDSFGSNAFGYDVQLDNVDVPAGGTYVFCREQRSTDSDCDSNALEPLGSNEARSKRGNPPGPCDMVVGTLLSGTCFMPYCNNQTAPKAL